jgi:GxxExxY protein
MMAWRPAYDRDMWDTLKKAETWSGAVIGAAIEVHRIEGPGLVEGIYKKCFSRECELRQIPYVKELEAKLEYKGFVFEEPVRLDFLIDDVLILEFKAVQELLPIHQAQLMTYMKLLKKPLGLLFNFHELILKNGIRRLVLKEAL